jgi:hypothetical protein
MEALFALWSFFILFIYYEIGCHISTFYDGRLDVWILSRNNVVDRGWMEEW